MWQWPTARDADTNNHAAQLSRGRWRTGYGGGGIDCVSGGEASEKRCASGCARMTMMFLFEKPLNEQAEASGARGRPIANPDAPAALPPARS